MEGRGEPRNFANWPVEFGKIFRGKLWALTITHNGCQLEQSTTKWNLA